MKLPCWLVGHKWEDVVLLRSISKGGDVNPFVIKRKGQRCKRCKRITGDEGMQEEAMRMCLNLDLRERLAWHELRYARPELYQELEEAQLGV